MNKAKYVEKMTDLVENTLLDMDVSPFFTIEDGWEEDDKLEMTLYHDANEHEITFNLTSLYQQKKEEDVKVKDQYRLNIKDRVVEFVERERALGIDDNLPFDEDYDEDYDEEEYGLEDDYDPDFDEDEEEDEEEDYDDVDYEDEDEEDDYDPDFDDEEDEEEENEEKPTSIISSSISDSLSPLRFVTIPAVENAMVATLPSNFKGTLSDVDKRYKKQIEELYEGCFIIRPNKKDIIALSSSYYDEDMIESILNDLLTEGGETDFLHYPNNEKER